MFDNHLKLLLTYETVPSILRIKVTCHQRACILPRQCSLFRRFIVYCTSKLWTKSDSGSFLS